MTVFKDESKVATLKKIMVCLMELLGGKDYEVRRSILSCFSKLRGQMAADIIFERYSSDNLEDYLAVLVSKVDPEKASKLLVAALDDPHQEARLAAAEALVLQKSDASVKVLNEIIESYLSGGKGTSGIVFSENALISAVKALGEIGDQMGLSLLKKLVLQEKNPKVKASGVIALGTHVTDKMLPTFQALLKDENPRVRANAIEALQNIENKSLVAILQPYLCDQHQRVRANAAKAIWKYGDFDVTDTIKEMLKDKEKSHRISAIYVIGELKLIPFLKMLVESLKNEDPNIRRNAVVALKKFQKPDHALHIVPLLDDEVVEVRTQAIYALMAIFKERSLEPFLKRLEKETSAVVRSVLISQLGDLKDERALNPISNFLSDDDDRVVSNSIEAIGKIKSENPSSGTSLTIRKFLQATDNRVRANAIKALWNWGDFDVLESLLEMISNKDPEKNRSGIYCLGEIFAIASAQGGELLEKLNSLLENEVQIQKRSLAAQSTGKTQSQIESLFSKVQSELSQNNVTLALSTLQELIKLAPDHLQAFIILGDIFFKTNKSPEAEEVFKKILSLQPNHVKTHYSLGQLYFKGKQWGKAKEEFLATVRLNPKLPQAFLFLADSLEAENHFSDAIKVLRRLQTLVPQNPTIMQRLAKLLVFEGSIGESVNWVSKANSIGPVDLESQLILAVGLFSNGKIEESCKVLFKVTQSLVNSPNQPNLLYLKQIMKTFESLFPALFSGPQNLGK